MNTNLELLTQRYMKFFHAMLKQRTYKDQRLPVSHFGKQVLSNLLRPKINNAC